MGTITSSHDQVRFIAFADGQVAFDENGTERAFTDPPETVQDSTSYDKLFMFMAFNMSLPGVPVIYYGEEIGQIGANDPDNRRMMRFGDELTPRETRLMQQVSRLVHARRSHPALSVGDLWVVYEDDETTAWLKSYFGERILILFNNSHKRKEIEFNLTPKSQRALSLIDGSSYSLKDGLLHMTMDPYETQILQLLP